MTHVVLLKSQISKTGGLEKISRRLVNGFLRRGCRITVLTSGNVPSQTDEDIEIVSFGAKKPLSLWAVHHFDQNCRRWLKNRQPEIIFGLDRNSHQTHYRAGNGVHAAYLAMRGQVQSPLQNFLLQINPLHKYLLKLEQRTYENDALQCVFANSHLVRTQILNHFAIDPAKVEVVHNGAEWDELAEPFDQWIQARPKLLRRHGLSQDVFHLLFVGGGYQRKGLAQLLRGMAVLQRRDLHLSIVGKDKETAYFQTLAAQLGLSARVRFFGPQSDVVPFYQMADALVIPSLYDPFANVTVEALSLGLFVVSSRTNGGSEVVTEQTGTVIDDIFLPESVAASLQIALNHPKTPESAATIRQHARSLDLESHVSQIVDATLGA